jgi:8-oxo-dGTP diphosphatase
MEHLVERADFAPHTAPIALRAPDVAATGLELEQRRVEPRPRRVKLRLRRAGYRAAWRGLRLYWFLFRPRSRGVKCVLTDGDLVLLVRHTYGPRSWDLPGGSIKRGEAPAAAASREMHEELGVLVDEWRSLGQFELVVDHRRDSLHCFQAELHAPRLVIDQGELGAVGWFPFDRLPRVGRYTQQVLARAGAHGGAGAAHGGPAGAGQPAL